MIVFGFFLQGEWDLPKFVDGVNVKVALSCQCAALD